MADSAFWRDLESRFRALQEQGGKELRVDWISTRWNERGDQWLIAGGKGDRGARLFKWLAERGAVGAGHPVTQTALFYWLDLLKSESPNFQGGISGLSVIDGREEEHTGGRIRNVCEASADYCLRLETEALAQRRSAPMQPIPISSGIQPTRPTPKAFVSYAWEDEAHRAWVRDFAARLRANGVDVTLDQWALQPGDRLPEFMERAVRENDFILIVCTPGFRDRSNRRQGGVGYEGDIMTGEVLTTGNERKFIPIFRSGSHWAEAAPTWLQGKYYIDLHGNPYSEDNYEDLITTLFGLRPGAPPLGPPPMPGARASMDVAVPTAEPSAFEPIRILGVIVDEITEPRLDGTRGSALYNIPFRLSKRPPSEWASLFIENWNHPRRWTTMHRPGIARISGDKIVLDGTTIEEVEQYHRETLKIALDDTNTEIGQRAVEDRAREENARAAEQRRRELLQSAAKRIKFD